MKEKLNRAGGFTLVEMLCTVAILTLLCLMLGTGMQMAMKTYRDITAESETQLLLNTLVDAVADELRYAYEAAEGADPSYNGGLQLTIDNGRVLAGGEDLLPKDKAGRGGAYHGGAYQAKDLTISYDMDTACFHLALEVFWTEDHSICAKTPEGGVTIRCLNPPKEETGTGEGTETP